jgi:hypothetical protein
MPMQLSKMMVMVTAYLIVGGVVIGATMAISAQQKRTAGLIRNVGLTADDYIEISQLYGLYTRDIDPGSTRSAAWMFTPDGVAVMERTVRGEKELKEYYDNVLKRAQRNGYRHVTASFVIVGTPDGGARGSAYNLGVQRTGEGKPLEFQGIGKYEDKLVKTKDGWRFKERVFVPDTFIGSDKQLPPSPIPDK